MWMLPTLIVCTSNMEFAILLFSFSSSEDPLLSPAHAAAVDSIVVNRWSQISN